MKAALYARFSCNKQSDKSCEDQLRDCKRFAERHGFAVVASFEDAAISGGTAKRRPAYQALLAAARRHEFDVVVAEDCSRLWRNLAEQAPRLAELADLGLHVVTQDLDTRQESAGILAAVLGASSEAYRKEIARRTRRGLEGVARSGRSAGGRSFGYVPAAHSASGRMEIDPLQARVVRQIFEWYASGWNSKAIAVELNKRRVPSPGSGWKREVRRANGWVRSAIPAMLANPLYRGLMVWNRVRWVRSAADSSERRCVPNPPSEWVTREDERLRIIPQRLWDRVQARFEERAAIIGAKVKAGVSRDRAVRRGRESKFPFPGLLKCGACGASFVMAGRDHYCCASRTHGGTAACSNDAYLRRSQIEPELVAGIKRELLPAPEVIEDLQRRVRQRLKDREAAPDNRAEIAKLEREVGRLVDAIASGTLGASAAIAQRLKHSEATLARLKAQPPAPNKSAEQLLPDLAKRCQLALQKLEHTIMVDPRRAQMEMREHVGPIRVTATPMEIRLEAQRGHFEQTLLRAAGCQTKLVAGAGFEPATFGL